MQMCENKAVREITNQVQKDMLIQEDTDMAKTLIAFFSRADENYFGGAMRYVKVGNTEIVVGLMKELIEADSFKIEMKDPYSPVYIPCFHNSLSNHVYVSAEGGYLVAVFLQSVIVDVIDITV